MHGGKAFGHLLMKQISCQSAKKAYCKVFQGISFLRNWMWNVNNLWKLASGKGLKRQNSF